MLRNACKSLEISLLSQPQNENMEHKIDFFLFHTDWLNAVLFTRWL